MIVVMVILVYIFMHPTRSASGCSQKAHVAILPR